MKENNADKENIISAKERVLEDEDLIMSIKIIHNIRIAISSIRLYPKNSSVVSDSIKDVFGKSQNIITKYGHVTFSVDADTLIINARIIKAHSDIKNIIPREYYESFINTMKQSHVRSMTFKEGMNLDQLTFFLNVFSEKHWRREGDMMVLSVILKEKGIDTITLNERIYKPVGDEDVIIDKGMDYLKRNEGEIDSMIRSLEEVVEMSVIDGKSINEEVRRNMVDRILGLNPEFLLKLFQRKGNPEVEDLKTNIVKGLPAYQMKEVIAKIVKVYKEIKENTPQGSVREKELIKLKETINMLLSSCKDQEITLAIFNELKDDDLEELLPPWWNKPEKSQLGLLISKARLLMEKDALELLDEDVQEELGEIIMEMERLGKEDIIRGLLEKLGENLRAFTATTRLEAANFYEKLKPKLHALSSNELAKYLENVMWEVIETESNNRVYEVMARDLEDSVQQAINEYDYEKAQQILNLFRKHRSLKKEGFSGRSELAAGYMKKVASSDVLRLLMDDLHSRDSIRQRNAYKVLIQMEEFICPYIINSIKKTRDLGLRGNMVWILKKIGQKAVLSVLSELEKDYSSEYMIRIIEVLPMLQQDSMSIRKLMLTINHYAPAVRLQTLNTAYQLDCDKKEIFLHALDDEDLKVRQVAIQMLGSMKEPGLFYKMAKRKKTDIEERTFCRALGKINLEKAADYLLSISGANRRIFGKVMSKEVSVAAIRALECYPGKKTYSALRKLSKNKDKFISSNASYVLEKIDESE